MYTIAQASKFLNVHPQTLRRWEKEGKINPVRLDSGHRRYSHKQLENIKNSDTTKPVIAVRKKSNITKSVKEESNIIEPAPNVRKNIIYCRVSSNKQKSNLDNQIQFMKELFPDYELITDIASGINFTRPGIKTILERLCAGDIGTIAVSFKDRLCRVGFEIFEHLARINGSKILVVHNITTSPEEELIQDLIALTTSFSARIHGLRKYRRGLREIIQEKRETSEMQDNLSQSSETSEENMEELDSSI